jgi:F-type H+-transporting ATPase subunit epsilon
VAKLFGVELVSAEAKVWSGEAEMVVARTTEGELGVLAGHAPLLGQLAEPSQVRIKLDGGQELAYEVGGGFLSVTTDGVTVLAESCVPVAAAAH